MKKINYKYILIILLIIISILFLKNKINNKDEIKLDNIYPKSAGLVDIYMGTYYNEKQIDYLKLTLPKNYSGWAMYLNNLNESITFSIANSHELSYSLEHGLLEQEEVIQQIHYSNKSISKDDSTNIYANILTAEQISYEDMKKQTINAKEISDIAFYSVGDKKYTDLDIMLYYKINDNIMLQILYKGPQTQKIGVEKVAYELYKSITKI